MEADESIGEDARSIAYFDMYVSQRGSVVCSRVPRLMCTNCLCRILQREGERDLFALRQPAMPSDDDADDGHDIDNDSADETQEEDSEGP